MKKIQLVSFITLAVSLAGLLLWRLSIPFPDWAVRTLGILMLAALFVAVFTTVRSRMQKG